MNDDWWIRKKKKGLLVPLYTWVCKCIEKARV
jgi:hypothetical protein